METKPITNRDISAFIQERSEIHRPKGVTSATIPNNTIMNLVINLSRLP